MIPLELVFTGTGRCATQAYARYAYASGLQCDHEAIFGPYGYKDAKNNRRRHPTLTGESSWMAAPYLNQPMLKEAFVVHLVRHPKSVIESWLRTPEKFWHYAHWQFAAKHMGIVLTSENLLTWLTERYVRWNQMIENGMVGHSYIRIRVETNPKQAFRELACCGLPIQVNPSDPIWKGRNINAHWQNAQPKTQFELQNVESERLREQLRSMASRYGYAL